MTTLASDNFTRSNQSGFGTASDGTNTWASPVNGSGTASISSNRGIFGNFNNDTQMICGSHSGTTDINMLVKVSTSDLNNLVGVLWRYSSASGGNGYRAGFYAGNTFNVDKYVNGSRSNIASSSITSYSANSDLWVRLIHTASGTLQIRWWADGNSEPGNFNSPFINQSETSFSSGNFGVSVYINSGGTASYGSYTVTDNSSGGSNTKSVSARFLQAINKAKSVGVRLRQAIPGAKSEQARLRLAVSTNKPIRFRLLVAINASRQVGARLLQALASNKYVGARFLQAISNTRLLLLRFKLAILRTQSLGARMRQALNSTKYSSIRFLQAIHQTGSSVIRLRVAANANKSTQGRLLQAIASTKSIGVRFVLGSSFTIKSVVSRLRLALSANRSMQARLRQAISGTTKYSSARLHQASSRTQSSGVRVRVATNGTRYASIRLLLATQRVISIGSRLRQANGSTKSSVVRFVLSSQLTRTKSLGCRFILGTVASAIHIAWTTDDMALNWTTDDMAVPWTTDNMTIDWRTED